MPFKGCHEALPDRTGVCAPNRSSFRAALATVHADAPHLSAAGAVEGTGDLAGAVTCR